MTEKIGLYAGSFDPITKGHLEIIRRSAKIFDKIIIAVMTNTSKQYMFTYAEKANFIKEQIVDLDNVEVVDGQQQLTVNLAAEYGVKFLIRSMRSAADFDYEAGISQINKLQNENLETVYLLADPKFANISSSMIKEMLKFGGNVSGLVTPQVESALKEKLN